MPDRPPRERDRYGRASWREQAADLARDLRTHPGIVLVLVLVVGGGLALALATPAAVSVADLRAGDCLYIHAGDADTDTPDGRPAGSSGAAITALYEEGAERAPCDGSHSHEVVGAFAFPEPAGAAYPGPGVLAERQSAACEAAFEAWVGRPSDGSELALAVAVPDRTAWDAGIRAGACLAARRDGQFLAGPAQGSGR